MKLDKEERRLQIISYLVTTVFIVMMLFPLWYILSLSLQGENAIYSYPPRLIPPAAQSVSIALDYSDYADMPGEELKDLILKDSTLAMYSTLYELDKENICEIKIYGTADGKTIYYARAHGLMLKMQMQYGVYYLCRIEPTVLLSNQRYLQSAEEIGYEFNTAGTGHALPAGFDGQQQNAIAEGIAGYLSNEFQTAGAYSGAGVYINNWLMLENFVYYFKVPQIIYKDFDNIRNYSFFAFIGNTLLTVLWTMFCQTMITALTAYPLSKLLKPRTANYVLLFFLATMMIPFVVVMVPQLLLIKRLGIFNTYAGMLLPALVPAPFTVYLYKGFFDRLPSSYFEAARIDGANELYTFFNICIPMSKAIVFLSALQAFIWGWGDFMWYYMAGNKPALWTLNVAIYTFSQMRDQVRQNFLMGMSLVIILPVIILTAVFSKQIKQSVMGSGLKE